ncbi:MAG: hypothetical protein GXP62_12340 [Oligoflexia bacterium]|nr:hypothetical protein [Oligoflexia bacterium]
MAAIEHLAVLARAPTLTQVVGFLVAGLLSATVVVVSPILALGLVLGLVAGLFFLVRPVETLLVALVARVFLDILWWVPFTFDGLNLSQIFSGVTFVMLCVITLLRARELRKCPVAAWSLAMIALLVFSAVRAIDLLGDIELLIRYMMAPLMVLSISVVFRDPATRRRLVKLLSIAALVPIGYSMFTLATGVNDYVLHGYDRLLGGYKNIHNHALVMMVFSVMFISWARAAERNWVRLGAWLVVGSSFAAIYYTYTRTGLLGWVLSVFVILVILKQWRLLSIVCTVGAIVVLMNPDVQDRFSDLVDVFDPSVRSVDRRSLGSGRSVDLVDACLPGAAHRGYSGWPGLGWLSAHDADLVPGIQSHGLDPGPAQ